MNAQHGNDQSAYRTVPVFPQPVNPGFVGRADFYAQNYMPPPIAAIVAPAAPSGMMANAGAIMSAGAVDLGRHASPWISPSGEVITNAYAISPTFQVITLLSAAASGYHGYKRNHDSVGYGFLWAFFSGVFPVIVPIVAVAQGFAKEEGRSNPGYARRAARRLGKSKRANPSAGETVYQLNDGHHNSYGEYTNRSETIGMYEGMKGNTSKYPGLHVLRISRPADGKGLDWEIVAGLGKGDKGHASWR